MLRELFQQLSLVSPLANALAIPLVSFLITPLAIVGALLWIGSLVYAGYFFGNIPWVKNNLSAVILGIVFLSILPGLIAFMKRKLAARMTA